MHDEDEDPIEAADLDNKDPLAGFTTDDDLLDEEDDDLDDDEEEPTDEDLDDPELI